MPEEGTQISGPTKDHFGESLQRAREGKGFSLDDVATQTRIPVQHLEALEREDFASLPAKVFVKGFVRSYSKVLGLDEEIILQHFLETSGRFYDQTEQEQQHVQVNLEAAHRRTFNWNLVAILFIGAVAMLWYWLPDQQEVPQEILEIPISETIEELPTPETPVADPPVEMTPSEPESTGLGPSTPTNELPDTLPDLVTTPPLDSSPPPTASSGPPSSPMETETVGDAQQVLEIEATQLTWVVVQSDKEDPQEALLQPGQRISWTAKKEFLLTLGNAAGVIIHLNGEAQGPFGKPGQVIRNIHLGS